MKKGFTIIEIIVCVALIGILGISSILIAINNNDNDLEKITKKVLEAANVYVETEKDENGNNYLEEVSKGAKGVQVPLSLLVNKGYIKEEIEENKTRSISRIL